MAKETVVPMKADAPRTMSRDDRRIIFGKLETCWSDEKKTYDQGWTDERVAKDLGVPRAWVSTVRDENFGPVANVDLDALNRENELHWAFLCGVQAKAREMSAQFKAASDIASEISDAIDIAIKTRAAAKAKAQ